jgi:FAD/FMN-containing dehydrogenase
MVAGADGFHHPADQVELVALVRAAYREGRQLRVRGAAHSVAHATYTDPLNAVPNPR